MCLWEIYIFPGSVHIFPAAEQADRSWEYINCSQTHEYGNWDCGRAIPFLGIFVSNFRFWFFGVFSRCTSSFYLIIITFKSCFIFHNSFCLTKLSYLLFMFFLYRKTWLIKWMPNFSCNSNSVKENVSKQYLCSENERQFVFTSIRICSGIIFVQLNNWNTV